MWKQNKGEGSSLDLQDKIRLSFPKTVGTSQDARAYIWSSKTKAVMFKTKVDHFPLLPSHQRVRVSPQLSGIICMPASESK